MTTAVLTGLLSGILLSRFRVRQLVLLIYHLPYRFWRHYGELYDTVCNELQKDLLNSYHKPQPRAQSHFKNLWDAFALQVGRDYIVVVLASLALFWSNYVAFILPFVLVQTIYAGYLYFYKQYRLDFFAILMIGLLIKQSK